MAHRKSRKPLQLDMLAQPEPITLQVLTVVHGGGICRSDPYVMDGESPHPAPLLIPGHQIVGNVVAMGPNVTARAPGQRIGVPSLEYMCTACRYCLSGPENLCDDARFTGYNINGGFAKYTVANASFCFPGSEG